MEQLIDPDNLFGLIRSKVSTRVLMDEVMVRLARLEERAKTKTEEARELPLKTHENGNGKNPVRRKKYYGKKKTWIAFSKDELMRVEEYAKNGYEPGRIARHLRRPYSSIYNMIKKNNWPLNVSH